MRRRGPLADSYPAAVALVICALVPFLTLTAAVLPLLPQLSKSLGLSNPALEVTIALSDAGYAFGTVLAVQFAVHLPRRRMLLGYVTAFVVAAMLAAWAPSGPVFAAAFVVEGLCTSLMLIAAVPPLVTGWPTAKMPWTASVMNLCVFGAVAVGPTVGGLQAAAGDWRSLFWVVAGVGVVALLFALLTYEDEAADDRSAPWGFVALALAGFGCVAAFFGAAQLEVSGPGPGSLVPLLVGIAMICALVVHQFRSRHPLMPVRQLRSSPRRCSEPCSAPGSPRVLAVSGLAVLTAAAALLTGLATGGGALVAVGSALIGFGVGASVSPALFIAGFSLRSSQIQRIFALVELLRGVTAFLVAPVLLYLATVIGTSLADGTRAAIWICLGIAAVGGITAVALFALGGERLQTPDLERWNEGETAWTSPELFARLRAQPAQPQAARPDAV